MRRHSSFMNFDTNRGSLSLIIFEGSPNQGKICQRNSSATPSAVIVSLQGIVISILVQSWSVIVRMESNPSDSGSFTIKSMARVQNGSAPVVGLWGIEMPSGGVCLLCFVGIACNP